MLVYLAVVLHVQLVLAFSDPLTSDLFGVVQPLCLTRDADPTFEAAL